MAWPGEICTILFDLDGTLRYNVPSYNETFFNLAAEMGVADSRPKRLSAARWIHYYWAQSPELVADMRQYDSLSEAFWTFYWQRTLVKFGCPVEDAQAMALEVLHRMREEYHPQDCVPQQVFETLQRLKDAGVVMAVVSNRTAPYDEQLARLGLTEYFAFALAAGEINSWKPAPDIFLHALERLETDPCQALYVGDNYYADVVGAQNAGLQAVLVDPEGIFPEVQCPVIRQVNELLDLLK